jgi:Flp pilus assembly pilin Flp
MRILKSRLSPSLRKLLLNTAAVTAIEYALIASGIAAVILPAANLMGVNISNILGEAADGLIVAVVESTDWPMSAAYNFINGTHFVLSGSGNITKAILLAKLSGLGYTPSQIRATQGVSMDIQGLTAEDIFAIRGGGTSLTLRNLAGAGVHFNGTPPPGGSIQSNGSGTYNYLNSSGVIIATVNCVACT